MDWDLLFKDFQSTVDWPTARYWRELADHYPDAKVLLSVRNPETWYKSVTDTIYRGMTMRMPDNVPEPRRLQMAMARKIVMEDTFDNRFEDKAHAIEVFNRYNQTVRETIDPGPPAGLRRQGRMGTAVPLSRRRAARRTVPAPQ